MVLVAAMIMDSYFFKRTDISLTGLVDVPVTLALMKSCTGTIELIQPDGDTVFHFIDEIKNKNLPA